MNKNLKEIYNSYFIHHDKKIFYKLIYSYIKYKYSQLTNLKFHHRRIDVVYEYYGDLEYKIKITYKSNSDTYISEINLVDLINFDKKIFQRILKINELKKNIKNGIPFTRNT